MFTPIVARRRKTFSHAGPATLLNSSWYGARAIGLLRLRRQLARGR